MLAKQILTDIGIILIAPVVVIGGYFFLGNSDATLLLSEVPSAVIGPNEPGAKTKFALDTLGGITLDDALFRDEAFTSLTAYAVEIPEVPLSRDYPFTPPPAILEKLRQARVAGGQAFDSVAAPTMSNISAKINQLKKTANK